MISLHQKNFWEELPLCPPPENIVHATLRCCLFWPGQNNHLLMVVMVQHHMWTKFPEVGRRICELRWNGMILKVLLMSFFPCQRGFCQKWSKLFMSIRWDRCLARACIASLQAFSDYSESRGMDYHASFMSACWIRDEAGEVWWDQNPPVSVCRCPDALTCYNAEWNLFKGRSLFCHSAIQLHVNEMFE